MIKTAIILAGGFGTRLQSVVSDVPKPMAEVAGRPFLEYLLDYLIHFGFNEVILSTGYKAEVVSDHFGDHYDGLAIKYAVERTPLGTGGAIQNSFGFTNSDEALILNGDSFFDVDLSAAMNLFEKSTSDGMVVLRNMPNPDRFGTVTLDDSKRIIQFEEKREGLTEGLINTGIYILDRSTFNRFGLLGAFSIEEDFFRPFIGEMNVLGYESIGYFIDIGIPEEFTKAQSDFQQFKYSNRV